MKRAVLAGCLCVLASVAIGGVDDDEFIIMRGDANVDSVVNGADPQFILNWLYSGGPAPPCLNQADANNDGAVYQSDAVYLLNWLYNGGPAPPSPGPYGTLCVADDYPYPGCAALTCP